MQVGSVWVRVAALLYPQAPRSLGGRRARGHASPPMGRSSMGFAASIDELYVVDVGDRDKGASARGAPPRMRLGGLWLAPQTPQNFHSRGPPDRVVAVWLG